MSKIYTESEVHTRDIDWFCAINGIYVHIASAGGRIPNLINNREVLRPIQRAVETLEAINTIEEVHINEDALQRIDMNREDYLPSFIRMVRKGFYSFDRTNIGAPEDNHYHLVAWPTHLVHDVENMPSIDYPGLDFDNPEEMHNICFDEIINCLAR